MSPTEGTPTETAKWDPHLVERTMGLLRPFLKVYTAARYAAWRTSRPAARSWWPTIPGGLFPMDVPVFALGFYDAFGYDRPVYTLSHDMLMTGPTAGFLIRNGFIRANRENADEALRSSGVVVGSPGGDYDVYRPTFAENKIDFERRTGYVQAALNTGVPIVPTVAIGGQENQIYLSRGTGLAKLLRLDELCGPRSCRSRSDSPSVSAPCCRSTCRCRQVVMRVLEPIDIREEFGEDPDIDTVDAYVRGVMQRAIEVSPPNVVFR